MKNKSTSYLLIAFAVLLILFIISKTTDQSVQQVRPLVEIDTTKIDMIHIVSPDNGEITMIIKDGIWKLQDPIEFPAEQRNITGMLQKFDEMQIESVASSRKDSYEEYEVDDSTGVYAEFKQGDKLLASFYLGKQASTRRHTYFRLPGEDEVYMVQGSYKYQFNRKLADWRNKVILELQPEGIESVKTIFPDHYYTLALRDTVWYCDDGKKEFEAYVKSVDPTLNYISRLRAADFYDPAEKAPDFDKFDSRIEITFSGGYQTGLTLVKEDGEKNRYYVKKDGEDIIYLIYQGTANILMKDIEDFRKRDEPVRPGTPPPPKRMDE